jgi:uncharacterized membrane protein YccC
MSKYFSINNKSLIYVFRVLLGITIVWWSLYYLHDDKKMWALVSVIMISEPDFDIVRSGTISRMINTVVGCAIGLFFIYIAGPSFLSLIAAIGVSVFISTSFKKYPTSWKLAPVTVVIVMVPGILDNISLKEDIVIALTRTGEVLYGSVVAFVLAAAFYVVEKRWGTPEMLASAPAPTAKKVHHKHRAKKK